MMKNVSRTVRLPVVIGWVGWVWCACYSCSRLVCLVWFIPWFIPWWWFMILCLVLWWLKREKIVSKCARTVAVCTRSSPKSCCVMAKKAISSEFIEGKKQLDADANRHARLTANSTRFFVRQSVARYAITNPHGGDFVFPKKKMETFCATCCPVVRSCRHIRKK